MNAVSITSIVNVAGYSCIAVASLIGLTCTMKAANRSLFILFYTLIIITSLLEITIGTLNLVHLNLSTSTLLFIQQNINNFSLVFQFSIYLTIAYAWSVVSSKLK